MKKVISTLSFLTTLAGLHAVEVGETKEAVLSELGKPKSSIQSSSREILTFEKRIVKLKDGIVEKVSFRPVRVASTEEKTEKKAPTLRKDVGLTQSYAASPYSGIIVVPGEIKLHPLSTQE